MSIQDPIKIPNLFQSDNDVTNIRLESDVTGPNDENRLYLIAHSFSPFSPSTGSIMEIEMESNNGTSIFQPAGVRSDQVKPDHSVAVSGPAADSDPRTNFSKLDQRTNKRKIEQHNSSSAGKRQVLGERDGQLSFQGKANHAISSLGSAAPSVGSQDLLSSYDNTYDSNSLGSFDVIVQKDKDNNPSSPIDPLAIGRLLYSSNKNDILEIKKVGFSKINIRFKSREAANRLIFNHILKEKKYQVSYIPHIVLLERASSAVSRLISLKKRGLDSKVSVLSVQRLSRRRRDPLSSTQPNVNININIASNNLTPSRTILITFGGQILPDSIYLFMLRYSVHPFVSRTSLCFSYFCFGAQCKGHARCIDCGGNRHGDGELPQKGLRTNLY